MISNEITITKDEYERLLRSEAYLMAVRTYLKTEPNPNIKTIKDLALVTKTNNGYQE